MRRHPRRIVFHNNLLPYILHHKKSKETCKEAYKYRRYMGCL